MLAAREQEAIDLPGTSGMLQAKADMLTYRANKKHKPGAFGEGPPRWFPDRDTPCPDDVSGEEAQALLEGSVEGEDASHPGAKGRYALDGQGRFFKGYIERIDGEHEIWHGYPVREELVRRQVPARVLRAFVQAGTLPKARYRKLLGSAS